MTLLGNGLDIATFTAGESLEAYVFCKIKEGKIFTPEVAGSYCDGVSLEQYNQGQTVLLRYLGTAKIVCGEEIEDSQFISTNEKGQAIPALDKHIIMGKALEFGVVGQLIQIMLLKIPNFSKEK